MKILVIKFKIKNFIKKITKLKINKIINIKTGGDDFFKEFNIDGIFNSYFTYSTS